MRRHIIVGAGSAGCVIASRLTEDASTRVLLLEAGPPDRDGRIRVPAAFNQLYRSEYDWAYFTARQPALADRRIFWPRGRTLGGSSSINAQIWTRGHPADFDSWAASGASGWSYGDVEAYFRRIEHFASPPSSRFGTTGPVHIGEQRSPNPLSAAFLDAVRRPGVAALAGPGDAAECQGAGFCPVTQHNGRRWSAADAYLRPALRRSNLEVVTGAHVRRILFDGRQATGVSYTADGQPRVASVEGGGEVIVCAGAVNSPQLLMQSGLGPAEHLKACGMEVSHDVPGVGRGLVDHVAAGVIHEVRRPITLATAKSLPNFLRWTLTGRGPLASSVAEASAFVRTREELIAPDLELLMLPVMFVDEGLSEPPGHGLTIAAINIAPLSRGSIELDAADPQGPPVIDPGYLTDDNGDDMRVLLEGVRLAREIVSARDFAKYRGAEYLPGEAAVTAESITAHVRAKAQTLYHPASTCRMGSDEGAVVDRSLRVRGIGGLRVADASIMPTLVRGHPNAAVMMIAERAADLLRDAY